MHESKAGAEHWRQDGIMSLRSTTLPTLSFKALERFSQNHSTFGAWEIFKICCHVFKEESDKNISSCAIFAGGGMQERDSKNLITEALIGGAWAEGAVPELSLKNHTNN